MVAGPAQGGNGSFAYDPLDNLRVLDQGSRQFRYHYDANNRLEQIKSPTGALLHSFGYDARGNTTSKDSGTLTFDRENRLTESRLPGYQSYVYDGLGRRVRERADATSTYFYYSHEGKLLFTNDHKTYTRTDQIYLSGSLVAARKVPYGTNSTPEVTYQHTDALGSPVAFTDASGNVTRRERMTAWGEPADGTWTNGPGYTGHQMDAASKLVYMQQRYYDPVVARFLSVDPIGASAMNGFNFTRFGYAAQNPFRFTDPDGRYVCEGSKSECASLRRYMKTLESAHASMEAGDMKDRLGSVLGQIGQEGDEGLTFEFGSYDSIAQNTSENVIGIDSKKLSDTSRALQGLNVGARRGFVDDAFGAAVIAHEVSHNLDRSSGEFHPVYFPWTLRARIITEGRAYNLQSAVDRALGLTSDLNRDGMNAGERILAVSGAVKGSVDEACAGRPTGGGTGC